MSFKPTPRLFWFLWIGTIASLVGFGLLAWGLSKGKTEPTRAKTLQWTDDDFSWAGGSDEQAFLAGQSRFFESPHPLANTRFTLEVSAQLGQTTDSFAAWGIGLANENGIWTIIAINGAGYVTARQCPIENLARLEQCPPLTEPSQQILTYWKPFRFIRSSTIPNTIRLDFQPNAHQLTLRLNREWMWNLPYSPMQQIVRWGIWVQGGPKSPSQIRWLTTRVWANE